MLLGFLQRFHGRLLGLGGILAPGQILLRFLHLGGRVVQGLRGFGRIGRGLLLHVLGGVANLPLLRGLVAQVLRLLLHQRCIRLELLFFFDQLLHLLLQLAQIGQHALRLLRLLLGLGQLLLQGATGLLQIGDGIGLLEWRLADFEFGVVALIKNGTRLLHPVEGVLEIGGGGRGHVVDVAAN